MKYDSELKSSYDDILFSVDGSHYQWDPSTPTPVEEGVC